MKLTNFYTVIGHRISGVLDAQEQYEQAKQLLLDGELESVTAARKPISLSRRSIVKEIGTFRKRLQQRLDELAEMKRSQAASALIKKQEALVKKAREMVEFLQKTTRPKDWHSIEGLTRAAIEFLEAMGGDEAYVDWYDRHRDLVEEIYGADRVWGGGPDLFYKILAALSPRNLVQRNLSMGMKAYQKQKEAVLAGEKGFTYSKENVPGSMPAHLKNLNRILRGEALGGRKVPPFSEALLGDPNAITVDMWMAILLFGHQNPNAREIRFAKVVMNKIAGKMGKTPRYVQGLLWEMVMQWWGKPATDFRKAIESEMSRNGSRKVSTLHKSSRSASLSPDDSPEEVADAILNFLEESLGSRDVSVENIE